MSQDIVVSTGGLGTPSTSSLLARQLGESAVRELASRGVQAELRVVELRDYANDITSNLLTGHAPQRLAQVIETVADAAGLVVVSPVFTASVSGLFKTFIDILDPALLEDKPMVLAATGGSPRHSMVID
ncbi:NAD(P)H-dependent oxidoreductase [Paeniglutamicibacter antarcticus]